ncbi:hypothetical protein [Mycobacterium camsae]|uniref:hypothetical protein n=1 Tax=Mycobacterium gordonae TaxID=1778 RepID=UPI00197E4940|nr:hypothetical protein [Mycobacterium gordonae]
MKVRDGVDGWAADRENLSGSTTVAGSVTVKPGTSASWFNGGLVPTDRYVLWGVFVRDAAEMGASGW